MAILLVLVVHAFVLNSYFEAVFQVKDTSFMDLGLRAAKVLVTAASNGLGSATARLFSLEGAQVVINSRDLSALQVTAAKISRESGNPVFTQAADITDHDAVEKMIRNSADSMGGKDILVTNTVRPSVGNFADSTVADLHKAINLTFGSTISLIKTAVPYLRASKRAAVLSVASIPTEQKVDNHILSHTTSSAIVALTKSLSIELGSEGIRFNSVIPGLTKTKQIEYLLNTKATKNNSTPDEEERSLTKDIPLGRIGTLEEFANATVFLCSPAAGYITGVSLPIDGGKI